MGEEFKPRKTYKIYMDGKPVSNIGNIKIDTDHVNEEALKILKNPIKLEGTMKVKLQK